VGIVSELLDIARISGTHAIDAHLSSGLLDGAGEWSRSSPPKLTVAPT
jgi:hypothetical protein